jgi:hypothetical protein
MKGDVTMARNQETPVTFNFPDDSVELITWPYVLKQLDENLKPVLDKMDSCNTHLNSIATTLEEMAKGGDEE